MSCSNYSCVLLGFLVALAFLTVSISFHPGRLVLKRKLRRPEAESEAHQCYELVCIAIALRAKVRPKRSVLRLDAACYIDTISHKHAGLPIFAIFRSACVLDLVAAIFTFLLDDRATSECVKKSRPCRKKKQTT